MQLSFSCTNAGWLLGLFIIVFAAVGLTAPFWIGAWIAIEMGLL
ncbi:MAG: hypothetical protein AAFX76_02685 [Planctomycetota bacterium]